MGWLDAIVEGGKSLIKNNAGQIASGVAGAVLGNKGGGSTKSGTTVETMPAWMTEAAQQMLQQSTQLASQPYQQYGGPRVAGLNQDQQDAANIVRGNVGQASGVMANAMGTLNPNAGQGMLARAGQFLNSADGSYTDPGVAEKFINPYTQNVIDKSRNEAMRTWNDEIMPGMEGMFVRNGNYGSSAMARTMGRNAADLTSRVQDNAGAMLSDAYQAGAGQFNTEQGQKGQLYQIASGLGQTEQNMNESGARTMTDLASQWSDQSGREVNALSNVGEQQRQIDQAAMDADFQNWGAAQGYSQEQLQQMLNTLQGVQGTGGRTTSTTGTEKDNNSPLKNAATGVALWNSVMGTGSGPKLDPKVTTADQAVNYTGPGDVRQVARGGLLRQIAHRRAA